MGPPENSKEREGGIFAVWSTTDVQKHVQKTCDWAVSNWALERKNGPRALKREKKRAFHLKKRTKRMAETAQIVNMEEKKMALKAEEGGDPGPRKKKNKGNKSLRTTASEKKNLHCQRGGKAGAEKSERLTFDFKGT